MCIFLSHISSGKRGREEKEAVGLRGCPGKVSRIPKRVAGYHLVREGMLVNPICVSSRFKVLLVWWRGCYLRCAQ